MNTSRPISPPIEIKNKIISDDISTTTTTTTTPTTTTTTGATTTTTTSTNGCTTPPNTPTGSPKASSKMPRSPSMGLTVGSGSGSSGDSMNDALNNIGSNSARTTASSDNGKSVELQNVLWKKGVLGSWHKCQCAITATRNFLYRRYAEDGSTPPEWHSKSLEDCVVKNAEGITNKPFSFALFLGNKKTILLAADNEEIKIEWVEQIRASSGSDLGKLKLIDLLEGMHDCVVVSDDKGVIIGYNKAAKQMFGYSHSEAIGKNVSMLMPLPNRQNHQSFINKHNSSGASTVIGVTRRVLGQRKDGTVFPLELGLGKIHSPEGVRFTATMREITTKSNTQTLSLVSDAHSAIQSNLMALTASVEIEFEKLRKRIMELEHDNKDAKDIIEGLHQKIEYHIHWREAAETVLRDKQRDEIQKILAKSDSRVNDDVTLTPKTDSDDVEAEQFRELQLQTSVLIYPNMIKELHTWLPGPIKIKKPTLMYSTSLHSTNIRTFLARCNVAPNLMLIRTNQNNVLGGFFSHGWVRSERYYGDGQCFLFTLLPRIKKFTWSHGQPTHFMMVSDSTLVVGGGKGHALWIDLEAQTAMTEACDTFDSDPLVITANNEPFKIDVLEIYAFL